MESRLEDVLNGIEENYLLPFLWQHGESELVIREEMAHVFNSGIRAVCVEARPHPDFLGPKWWQDMDVILDEARTRGMRVWILDDDHFPTGHAAGKIENAPERLRRLFLRDRHIDAIGPQKGASFLIKPWAINPPNFKDLDDYHLLAAIAARREATSDQLTGEFIDLTGQVQNDILYWDIPEGTWRVFLLITTRSGGSEPYKNYLNPLIGDSVQVLIDTVYEAFYDHYREDFGHTIAGFFSDEPGFYNDKTTYSYDSVLGRKGMDLPWRPDLLSLLEADFGPDYQRYLPLLWHDFGELSAAVRFTYMNRVSELYAEEFTRRIGDWCRAHRVEYIGHLIEDNGAHARLGTGAGHFFRALWGQDMSGIDVVLWQLMPGFDEGPYDMESGQADGEFYNYGLAKMGSSLGHIDPKKKGRTMCEVFGAFGWCEGLKLMKWMTDFMLVRGVNYFVPHAFSQAEFPDLDCPPHFYARGKNPQYRYYSELNRYTNRLSHLLSGGRHISSAAVLYHAEAEWSGMAMPFQKPVKELMQHQIDCDVIPGDALIQLASVQDQLLRIGEETYSCLIIPFSEALPSALIDRLIVLTGQGLPVLFIEALPKRTSEGKKDEIEKLTGQKEIVILGLAQLAHRVRELNFHEIEVEGTHPHLRYYHVAHPDLQVYLFSNENPHQTINTRISIPSIANGLVYDGFRNQVSILDFKKHENSIEFSLTLSPYESRAIVSGTGIDRWVAGLPAQKAKPEKQQEWTLRATWDVGIATSEQYPVFNPYQSISELSNLSAPARLPAFSGTFRYEAEFDWNKEIKSGFLDLGEVYETAEVWLNGQPCGLRICPPYRFEIDGLLRQGKNNLVIEVTNTLVKEQIEYFSRYAQQEPSGLLGPVRFIFLAKNE
jgi:hypothetical protein